MTMRQRQWAMAASIAFCAMSGSYAPGAQPASSPPEIIQARGGNSLPTSTGTIEFAPATKPTASPEVKGRPALILASPYSPVVRDVASPAASAPPMPLTVAPSQRMLSNRQVKTADFSVAPSGSVAPSCASDRYDAARRPSFWNRCKHNLQDCFLGYPGEFQATQLGQFLYETNKTQVANGEAALMTLYHYDFQEGREGLTSRGKDQVAKIRAMLPQNFFPIVIERSPDAPGLAESRRRIILNELAKGPFPVPPERVVIGAPLADGLSGVEAEIIYRNLLSQTINAGVSSGGTTGGPTGAARTPTAVSPPSGQ
ncbi:MAG: hypothetical protein ACJ8FY_27090 [Gemmataceae bacterium]